ncbi:MAG: DUF86 domain-containing protein [Candidatus Odinarchaeota archaeon]|nr:DUF86 domain-containing protein [Candidatus Odinarchaeota archaeon]
MDTDREKKYRNEFNKIYKNMQLLSEWLKPVSAEEFISDAKTRYASYKAFQEIIEALMDISAMIVKDIGEEPKDDYTNLETLVKHKVISLEQSDTLASANSLRNWIIHRYNKINDSVAYERMLDLIKNIEDIVEVFTSWLEKI